MTDDNKSTVNQTRVDECFDPERVQVQVWFNVYGKFSRLGIEVTPLFDKGVSERFSVVADALMDEMARAAKERLHEMSQEYVKK